MAYVGNVPQVGNYRKMDDISSLFNGSLQTFNITVGGAAVAPPTSFCMMVSLAGVVLNPDVGFSITAATISFPSPPAPLTSFFGIIMGDSLYTGIPSDATVTASKISTGAVTYNKFSTTTQATLLANSIIFGV